MSQDSPVSYNCPVCACPLSGEVDVCTSCKTPHHKDCARFVGRCAMFGCGAYEFLSLDAEAAKVFVTDAIIDGRQSGADLDLTTTTRTGLRRGILSRLRASVQLLRCNPGIAFSLGAFVAVLNLLPMPLPFLGFILGQAMLVVLFTARAKGKESTFREALSLTNQRGGRIILTGLASSFAFGIPLGIGVGLIAVGLSAFKLLFLIPGLLFALLGARLMVNYQLVPIVAAMGRDEEPDNALSRSSELVGVGFWQVAGSMLLGLLAGGALGGLLEANFPLIGVLINSALFMVSNTYWLLYYLEARRVREQHYLPHAPEHFLPDGRQP
ncbi:MAG: hypothetical protein HY815_05935 [Candidatus Riflebacteria bacterium]|nr:hypothetical protein [Candidatus Riflebacteria bacterium]